MRKFFNLTIITLCILLTSVLFLFCGPKGPFTLTISVTPEGSGTVTASVEPPAEGYAAGTEVTLTTEAEGGYDFLRWTDGEGTELTAETDDSLKLTMNENKTVIAVFDGSPAELIVTATPHTDVTSGTLVLSLSEDNTNFDELFTQNYTTTQFTASETFYPGTYYIKVEDDNDVSTSCRVTIASWTFADDTTYDYEIDMNTGVVAQDDIGVGSLLGENWTDCVE